MTGGADPAAVARAQNTPRNAPCPCGSGGKYKRCCLSKDEVATRIFKQIEGIEMAVAHLDRFERSIVDKDPILGLQRLCTEPTSPKNGSYTADAYMCDRWSGVQGAAQAREGAAINVSADELKDKVGDGN